MLRCGDVGRTAVTCCVDGDSCGPKHVAVCDVALQYGAVVWHCSVMLDGLVG
jgi:hypothetical protein